MACFLVPGAEAIIVTAAALAMKSSYTKKARLAPEGGNEVKGESGAEKVPFHQKLMWLAKLLWGGVLLLCFEHIWHGEVVPYAPFLTAMSDPGETQIMLREMASVGGAMAIWLTAVWVGMLVVSKIVVSRSRAKLAAAA